ncbi:unnamed protein product, partial [Didymodactylos carnosus]
ADGTDYIQIPFLSSVRNIILLPEVQNTLANPPMNSNGVEILDYTNAKFYKSLPAWKKETLFFEMSCDDLTLTNQVTNRKHKLFLFYWGLLNLGREQRSKQLWKRLLAVVPKKTMLETTIAQIMSDFINGLLTLWFEGININDYKNTLDQKQTKMTLDIYRQRCHDIEKFDDITQLRAKEERRIMWGINARSAFERLPYFDITRQVLFDPLHVLLEEICKRMLNIFLIHCVDRRLFDLTLFCQKVRSFPFTRLQKRSKPKLNIT